LLFVRQRFHAGQLLAFQKLKRSAAASADMRDLVGYAVARNCLCVADRLCDAFCFGWAGVQRSGVEIAQAVTAALKNLREGPSFESGKVGDLRHLREVNIFIPDVRQQFQLMLLLFR
jgi:hypothetical protein